MNGEQNKLEEAIRAFRKVIVAFSGGVDSALLAYVARRQLGRANVIAVTGDSASVPSRDRHFVADFCAQYDIVHRFLPTHEMDDPNYKNNPQNRCFFCKQELYRRLKEFSVKENILHILDGTHVDDLGGPRPGLDAIRKLEILTPYITLQMGKDSIRRMAADFGLAVAEKPQAACLSSRIPTGTAIDPAVLARIDAAENFLKDLGIKNPRVRVHGEHRTMARLEMKKEDWPVCLDRGGEIVDALQKLGFGNVTLDLKEYSRRG